MTVRLIVILQGVLTLSSPAFSQSYFQAPKMDSKRETVVLVGEEGRWLIDVLRTASDGFPERVSRERFPAFREAKKSFKQLTGVNESAGIPSSQDSKTVEIRTAGEPLWEAKELWNQDWENRYSEWFKKEVSKTFLKDLGIESDCADLAYISRWIFARIHSLPAANRLSASPILMTQRTMRDQWSALPTSQDWKQDKRFFAAIRYLTDLSYTHTLMRDIYPIQIHPGSFEAGVVNLQLHGNTGHTMMVARIDPTGEGIPVEFYWSNVPKVIRELYTSMLAPSWGDEWAKEGEFGFFRFRWPVLKKNSNGIDEFVLLENEKHPYFSKEQFSREALGDSNFGLAVIKRIAENFDGKKLSKRLASDLRERIQDRISVVEEGFKKCSPVGQCDEKSIDYDNYSTPTRDQKILDAFNTYFKSSGALVLEKERPEMEEWGNQYLNEKVFNVFGESYSMRQVYFIWKHGLFDSDPRLPIENRWGLEPRWTYQNLMKKLGVGLENRTKKIESKEGKFCSNTPLDCPPESEAWKLSETYITDSILLKYMGLNRKFRNYFPKEKSDEFDALLRTNFIGGVSITDWMDRILSMSSDPRASTEEKLGVLPGWKSIRIGQSYDFKKTTDGKWGVGRFDISTSKRSIPHLIEIATGEAFLDEESGSEFVGLNASSGHPFSVRLTDESVGLSEFTPHDSSPRTRTQFPKIQGTNALITSFTSGAYGVLQGNHFDYWHPASMTEAHYTFLETKLRESEIPTLSSLSWARKEGNQGFKLYDFDSFPVRELEVPSRYENWSAVSLKKGILLTSPDHSSLTVYFPGEKTLPIEFVGKTGFKYSTFYLLSKNFQTDWIGFSEKKEKDPKARPVASIWRFTANPSEPLKKVWDVPADVCGFNSVYQPKPDRWMISGLPYSSSSSLDCEYDSSVRSGYSLRAEEKAVPFSLPFPEGAVIRDFTSHGIYWMEKKGARTARFFPLEEGIEPRQFDRALNNAFSISETEDLIFFENTNDPEKRKTSGFVFNTQSGKLSDRPFLSAFYETNSERYIQSGSWDSIWMGYYSGEDSYYPKWGNVKYLYNESARWHPLLRERSSLGEFYIEDYSNYDERRYYYGGF